MIVIDFPIPDFKIKEVNEKQYILDPIRKRWLLLQDEEWVRQNVINYFIKKLEYPLALIAVEKKLIFGELTKRFDMLVYNLQHQPWMLVECKASDVVLSQKTIQQLLNYNLSMPSAYLVITNGRQTYCWKKTNNGLEEQSAFPEFIANN